MTNEATSLPVPDFRALFEAAPGLCLVLLPDEPQFTVVAVSDAYLRAAMTERAAILGRGLFEMFPDNPDDPNAGGVRNLRASLHRVLEQHAPHTMAAQEYNIRKPAREGGGLEERYWSPVNTPVLGAGGEVAYILHQVEDVTALVRLEQANKAELRLSRSEFVRDITESKRREEEQRAVMSSARCLIWHSDVRESGKHDLDWYLYPLDEAAAQRLLPLEISPGKNHITVWTESHLPGDRQRMDETANRKVREGQSYSQEFRCRNKYGQIQWLKEDVQVETLAPGRWRIVGVTTDITERKQAEEKLRESEEQFRATFEQAAVGIAHVGLDGRWLRVNRKLCEIVGYGREELLVCTFQDITHPDDLDTDLTYVRQVLAGEISTYAMEKRYFRKDGSLVWINLTVSLARHPSGEPNYFISVVEDITARKRLEDQLLQAQKLESVGRLAGGIAHDFNNLLTAILGYGELIEEGYALEPGLREYLHIMTQAADRASHLTAQLLAFARRQVIEPKVVNLNDLIVNLNKLLRRLIGEHIELVVLPEEGLFSVRVDPGQFEQILVNLIVNARDAMPDGGKIAIETHNTTLDTDYCRHHEGVTPGEYAVVVVSDTGTGMEEAIRLHIFEPFFTTKEKGRGTGLGLATVYGIVKQAGGHIWLYSEPGEGTTFKIYLPRTTAPVETITAPPLPPDQLSGSETILLVEDEPAVRTLAAQVLRGRGYTVLEAINGEEARRLAEGQEREIALLVTDVIMPQMSGKELADRLQAIHPGLKILYASGYTENTIVHHGVLEPGVAFLSKPFTPTALARKVREVLDSGR